MKRPDYLNEIKRLIIESEKGSIYNLSDFSHIANISNVKMCFSRLEKDGIIRRILRGIYEYPEYNDFLGEYISPAPDKVAHALARNYGWTIIPCGDTALNMMGLSTQVPSVWLYVSDGTYKEYNYGNVTIKFKRTTNKEISSLSYKTALTIQAIKAIGKENIDVKTVTKIASVITLTEKKIMLRESQYSTAWVYEVIKKVCLI